MADVKNTLVLEMFFRLGVLVVTAGTFFLAWWAPLLVAPLLWQILNYAFLRQYRSYHLSIEVTMTTVFVQRRMANILTWLFAMGYVALATVLLGFHVDRTFGWTAGAVLGLLVGPVLGAFLPHRVLRERKIQREKDAIRQKAEDEIEEARSQRRKKRVEV